MKDQELARLVGKHVRELRQAKGLSQEDLADQCGLHRTFMGSVERGEKAITLESARKTVTALGIKLSEFFAGIGE